MAIIATCFTLCLDPTIKLSVTLSNLNGLSKFLQCWKDYEICYKTHMTLPTSPLGTLLHYLGKLKIPIFCRYSADIEENANKIHFKCIDFNFSVRITVVWVYLCVSIKILSLSLNTMLIVDEHCSDVCCDEFPVPQTDRKSKQVKDSGVENFICNQYGEQLAIWNTENIKICGWIRKLEATNMQKIWIFNFPK